MTPKSLGILGAVAIVLIALVFLTKKENPQQKFEDKAQTIAQRTFFAGVKPDQIAKIRIEHPGEKPVELERDSYNEPWEVRTPSGLRDIDAGRQSVISKDGDQEELIGDRIGTQQAEKADSQKSFGTDAESAVLVTFFDAAGKQLEKIYIGRPSQGGSHTYVRPADSDATFMIPGLLTNNFTGRTILDWRDRRVFPDMLPDNIHQIVYEDTLQTTASYTLLRASTDPQDTEFTIEHAGGKDTARTAFARGATIAITNFFAANYADLMEEKPDFTNPRYKITFSTNDHGSSVTLTLTGESTSTPGHHFAKTNVSDDIYLVLPPRGLMRPPQEFIPPPTPTPVPTPTPAPEVPEPTAETSLDSEGNPEVNPTPGPPPTPMPIGTTPEPIVPMPPEGS